MPPAEGGGMEIYMKKILLLGGSAQQIVAIDTAKRLGLFTILCDYLMNNPGQYSSDKFYLVSTTDKEAILKIAIEERIDYIIAYASDPAAPTAAYVAEKLNLPTNPYKAVKTLCNKDLFREFLHSNGFHTPMALGFVCKEDAINSVNKFSLPIIIKPVDSSGSKGVTILRNLNQLNQAMDLAFSFSRAHRIIIEEYIEKKHPYLIGGDIFVSDGRVVQWGLMNCHRDYSVNPLVPVGKSFPPILEMDDLQAVKDTLQDIVSKLGIKFGPMNVELIIDKNDRVFPIDIGPRSGGNMIPDLLGMIFNCNVVEMAIHASMGEKVDVFWKNGTPYYATHNLHSNRNGIFQNVKFDSEIEPYIIRKCIYKNSGDIVHAFNNASDALGIVFFKFNTDLEMNRYLVDINKHIQINVK